MDPFSISVGALTLLGALGTTTKTLKKLISLRKAPEELLQLINEISDFRLTVIKTEEIIRALDSADCGDPIVAALNGLKTRAQKPVDRLKHLLEEHIVENYGSIEPGSNTPVEFSMRSWAKRQEEARRLRVDIKECRSKIEHALVLNTSSSMPRFSSQLAEIVVESRELKAHLQHISSRLVSRPRGTTGTSAPSNATESITPGANNLAVTESRLVKALKKGSATRSAASPTLCVSTDLLMSRECAALVCTCRCHQEQRLNPLPWASSLIGKLLIGYSGLPLPFSLRVECNEKGCGATPRSLIKVAWYFPSWFPLAGRMISIIDKWTPLAGHDISIRLPRVVPSSADIFMLAQKGNISGLQQLISRNQASVYDVSVGEGRSALHFALTADQPEMAAFLLRQRSSEVLEDHNFLSPIDLVWNYMLEDPNEPIHLAFKQVFRDHMDEDDVLEKRRFSALHLIVFGLSSVTLEAMLDLSTTEIDVPCSLGRTPLCWAALRQDPVHVRTLVSRGAALHIADVRGQNALHFASETGALESLRTLLTTAAQMIEASDPKRVQCEDALIHEDVSAFCRELIEARDYKGRTALHFATRMDQFEHAQLLLLYGADIDSPDAALSRTPILIAIYWNHHRMIKLFLDAGARTDIVDANGMTILHYAAQFGDVDTLAVLGSSGLRRINPEMRDMKGLTPSEIFEQVRTELLRETDEVYALAKRRFDGIVSNMGPVLVQEEESDEEDRCSDSDVWYDATSSYHGSLADSISSVRDLMV